LLQLIESVTTRTSETRGGEWHEPFRHSHGVGPIVIRRDGCCFPDRGLDGWLIGLGDGYFVWGHLVPEWLKGVITMEWDWGNAVFAMSAIVGLLAGVIQFVEVARSEQSVPDAPTGTSR